MKRTSLKFKNYTDNVNIINNNNLHKRIFNSMIFFLVLIIGLYIFSLGNIVFNIVERKNIEMNIRTLASEVRDLELNYLSLSSNLDLNYSALIGFKETKINFANRKSLSFQSFDNVKISRNGI